MHKIKPHNGSSINNPNNNNCMGLTFTTWNHMPKNNEVTRPRETLGSLTPEKCLETYSREHWLVTNNIIKLILNKPKFQSLS